MHEIKTKKAMSACDDNHSWHNWNCWSYRCCQQIICGKKHSFNGWLSSVKTTTKTNSVSINKTEYKTIKLFSIYRLMFSFVMRKTKWMCVIKKICKVMWSRQKSLIQSRFFMPKYTFTNPFQHFITVPILILDWSTTMLMTRTYQFQHFFSVSETSKYCSVITVYYRSAMLKING